jgi:hypothetical protein
MNLKLKARVDGDANSKSKLEERREIDTLYTYPANDL